MSIDLTKEETEKLILVALDELQQNPSILEYGVNLEELARAVNIDEREIKLYIKNLKQKNALNCRFDEARGGKFYITTTTQTTEELKKINTLTLNATAELILKKSFDIYKRAGYDSSFQFDSTLIGGISGINNLSKIRSAIEYLESKGLINNPAIMADSVIYFISARGIDLVEKMERKQQENSLKEVQMATEKEKIENSVFIVHGRNDGIKAEVASFLMKLKLTPIILHEQVNQGKTVIEKFEKYSDVNVAVILFTADDLGRYKEDKEDEARVRQNVIFEAGYFIGKLGREYTIILYEKGLTIPSDLGGYIYISLDENKRWHLDLAKELKAMGLNVDINNA